MLTEHAWYPVNALTAVLCPECREANVFVGAEKGCLKCSAVAILIEKFLPELDD